ncbi:MAG: acylneuraminate cytidylyltransferase family protein [Planctomycetes bacterium]|nr:acylneuraminate cytidylyltransferase family protein [Planctomycetota bacterium]
MDEKLLALIPARGGSKGLPGKNVVPLAGKPLIAWTIEAAIDSGLFERVAVSTDDQEIAEVAERFNAKVPFMRPAELASDSARTIDVAKHALAHYDALGRHFDAIVVLQPTSPLRNAQDIQRAVLKAGGHALISVCEVEHPIQWALSLSDDGTLLRHPDLVSRDATRRQDTTRALRPNGAIYVWPRAYIEAGVAGLPPDCLAYEMPRERSIDIDDETDLLIAKALMARR